MHLRFLSKIKVSLEGITVTEILEGWFEMSPAEPDTVLELVRKEEREASRVSMEQRYRNKRKLFIIKRLGLKLGLYVSCTSFPLLSRKKKRNTFFK